MEFKISIRTSRADDDEIVGELLIQAFQEAYKRIKPDFDMPADRLIELRATRPRREEAHVLIAETAQNWVSAY